MSLTRKGMKAMGLTEEQVDSIAEAHGETVEGLNAKIKQLQETVDGLNAQLKTAEANNGYKEKYDTEHAAFEAYKKTVEGREKQAAKETAAKSYFEEKNITGTNLKIAMRAAAAEIAALELDGDKIKDTAALDALTSGTLAGLAKQTAVIGANIAHPPQTTGGTALSKSDIFARDERGRYKLSSGERQRAIAANLAQKKG